MQEGGVHGGEDTDALRGPGPAQRRQQGGPDGVEPDDDHGAVRAVGGVPEGGDERGVGRTGERGGPGEARRVGPDHEVVTEEQPRGAGQGVRAPAEAGPGDDDDGVLAAHRGLDPVVGVALEGGGGERGVDTQLGEVEVAQAGQGRRVRRGRVGRPATPA